MRKIISLALCCFVLFTNAQNLKPFKAANGLWGYKDVQFDEIIIQPKYNSAEEFSEGLAMVSVFSFTKSHRFGFIDKTGKEIIPLKYVKADKFSEGLAPIKTDMGKISFIDKTGKEVLKTIYTDARSFSGGMAAVMLVKQMGFINKNGETVIPPIYDGANDFIDDCTIASLGNVTIQIDKTGKELPLLSEYGYVDRLQKKVVIDPSKFIDGRGFNADGLAVVGVAVGNTTLYGAIDKTGKLIIQPKYKDVKRLSNGLYRVTLNLKHGIVNKNGEELIPLKYKDIYDHSKLLCFGKTTDNMLVIINQYGKEVIEPFSETHHNSDGFLGLKKYDKYGGINDSGKLIIPIKYSSLYNWDAKGLITIRDTGKNALVDNTGKFITGFKYDHIHTYKNGFARIILNRKYGFINKYGKEIAKPQYNELNNFSDNMALFEKNGLKGFIDINGKEIITAKYKQATNFIEGLAAVAINGKWGYINKIGKEVIAAKFTNASEFNDGIAVVEELSKFVFIDKQGKYLFQQKFDSARNFYKNSASVKMNGKWGLIDKKGSWIIQPNYEDIGNLAEGKIGVKINGRWGFIDIKEKIIITPQFLAIKEFSEGFGLAYHYADYAKRNVWSYIDSTGKRIFGISYETAEPYVNGKAKVSGYATAYYYIGRDGYRIGMQKENVHGEKNYVLFNRSPNKNNTASTKSKKPNVTPADKKLNYSFTKYYAYTRVSGYDNFVESNYKVVVNRDFIQVYIEGKNGLYTLWNEYKIVASDEMKESGQAPDMAYLSSNDKLLLFIRKEGRDLLRIGNRSGDSYTEYISNKN